MAKLSNVLMRIFGSGAGTDQIAQFGSLFAGSPAFTTDPATAQSLSNYLTGWFAAAIGGNSPAIEDMNALFFAMSYQLALYQQDGIPVWISTKTYYIGSLANDGLGAIYVSITDDNTGNSLSDATKWTKVAGKVMDTLGDIIYGGVNGAITKLGGNTTAVRQFLTQTGNGSSSAPPQWQDVKAPTQQTFAGGSGTYTTPAGVVYIRVRMCGGGGGGASGGTPATGANGNFSTFGTSLLTCNGGLAGDAALNGGLGGSAVINSPAYGTSWSGASGQGGQSSGSSSGTNGSSGGQGGGTALFNGAGAGGKHTGSGGNGITNSGAGGGGGGVGTSGSMFSGGGGGAGGSIDAIIPNPSPTYSYVVGASAAGGATSATTGGAGAAGYIEVTEYYQ